MEENKQELNDKVAEDKKQHAIGFLNYCMEKDSDYIPIEDRYNEYLITINNKNIKNIKI